MKKPPSSGPATLASAEHGAEVALVAAALAGRTTSAMIAWRQHDQAAGAQALDGAEGDELGHVVREAGTGPSPTRKTTMATWNIRLRPNRSPSLP